MNKPLAVLLGTTIAIAAASFTEAQTQPPARHRVLLEVTSGEPAEWAGALGNVENLQKAFASEKVQAEVVVHGDGLGMLMEAKNGAVRDKLARLAAGGTVFAACRNTMDRKGVTPAQLSRAAVTVDSGVAEVVRKQEADWSYVRIAR